MDSMLFDVWTADVESPLRSQLFVISVSYEHINVDNVAWLITLGTVSVREGGVVVISTRSLDVKPLQTRLAQALDARETAVDYLLLKPPQHGTLQVTTTSTSYFITNHTTHGPDLQTILRFINRKILLR